MDYSKFIQPRDVKIGKREFSVSKIPAIPAIPIRNEVVRLVREYGLLGLSMADVELTKSLLQYTAVRNENNDWLVLDSASRIDSTFEGSNGDLLSLTVEMIRENFGFFVDGSLPVLLGTAEAPLLAADLD